MLFVVKESGSMKWGLVDSFTGALPHCCELHTIFS